MSSGKKIGLGLAVAGAARGLKRRRNQSRSTRRFFLRALYRAVIRRRISPYRRRHDGDADCVGHAEIDWTPFGVSSPNLLYLNNDR